MIECIALIKRAKSSIRSAEVLFADEDYNESVSRSYYAMFYAAEAVLLTKAVKFKSHRSVISQFGLHFVRTGIFRPEIGTYLNESFDRRLTGDYSYVIDITQLTAQETLAWAKEFVEVVTAYLKETGNI